MPYRAHCANFGSSIHQFNNTIIAYMDPRILMLNIRPIPSAIATQSNTRIEAHRVYSQDKTQQACNHENMSQLQGRPSEYPAFLPP
jgi:hypothetical protein